MATKLFNSSVFGYPQFNTGETIKTRLFNRGVFGYPQFNTGERDVAKTRLFNRGIFASPPMFNTGEEIAVEQPEVIVTGGGIPSGDGWTWEYQRRVMEAEYYWQEQGRLKEEADREVARRAEELSQAEEEQSRTRKIAALREILAAERAKTALVAAEVNRAHERYLQALAALTAVQEAEKQRIREEAERVQAEALAAENVRLAKEEQDLVNVMMLFMMEV